MIFLLARRLLVAIPVVILLSILVFALLYLMPGDPALAILGQDASQENLEALREELGLNRPAIVQYLSWAGRAIQGDLGKTLSFRPNIPVSEEIIRRLPVSLELMGIALLIAVFVGMTMGVIAALHRNSPLDLVVTGLSVSGIAMPSFWLGILLILLFGVKLRLLPVSGFVPISESLTENLRHMILPAGVLGFAIAALVARFARSEVLEVLGQDYIRTARAMGLYERIIIMRHVLRNALIPVVTLLGILIGRMVSGAVVLETLFALPGIGRLMVNGVFNRDLPLVQGTVLLVSISVVISNLLVDIAYGYLDPRIRHV